MLKLFSCFNFEIGPKLYVARRKFAATIVKDRDVSYDPGIPSQWDWFKAVTLTTVAFFTT
jgi:hypothetical protein